MAAAPSPGMRISWLSIVVVLASAGLASAGVARAERRSAERAPAAAVALSQGEIEAQVRPLSSEISRCYVDAAAAVHGGGQLRVELAIHRRGKLDAVTVATPGLPAKVALRIESCVRGVVAPLEFPMRRTSTTAVIPFYFQRTDAPNAGPQLSCWNPRGCPGQ